MNYEDFIRQRITELRLRKGVSEYKMSRELGHSRGYIYNISSGKALPPMKDFIAICDYFGITPEEFFKEDTKYPELIQKILKELQYLSDEQLLFILSTINHIK